VLARETPDQVRSAVRRLLDENPDRSRWILSCAGGMPPSVATENLRAFLDEAAAYAAAPGADPIDDSRQ
jgi:uroporphyrinogen-III decarboxylase